MIYIIAGDSIIGYLLEVAKKQNLQLENSTQFIQNMSIINLLISVDLSCRKNYPCI